MRHFDQFRYLPIKVTRDGWGRESHLLADCQNRGNLRCNLYVVFSNPREAVAVRVGLFPPDAEGWIDVDNARVAPNPPADFTFPAEPLVDELHQWKSRDWPGKANSIAEVAEALQIQLCARQIRAARLNLRYLLSQDPPASEFHECAPSG